ncbi:hypothetical protein PYW07_010768 [Mythimna separata]|uniref:Protein cueball n=1 Tax=Mythimna separata TaxID=271217 RepID=A0AAD8DKP7_MYTSE|nr:hypothetical protein PYW07_010768 [Mythimna separata]
MHCTGVLVWLALLVGLANSFPWEIVVANETILRFYNNGTLTHTEEMKSARYITSVTYDPVHNRVFFTDDMNPIMTISSFDLSTRKIETIVNTTSIGGYFRVIYEPVTNVLFCMSSEDIYSFPLNGTSYSFIDRYYPLITLEYTGGDIAVESCGGYIYWVTNNEVARARLNGSEREVLIGEKVSYRLSLVIDQPTQKMYWVERTYENNVYQLSIESADFFGKNRATFYVIKDTLYDFVFSFAVSNEFIYWQVDKKGKEKIWRIPKNLHGDVPKTVYTVSGPDCWLCHRIAAKYTVKEQIQGAKNCDSLQTLIPRNSNARCTASLCQNYCFQGDCSVSAEDQPTCRCKAGYSGERCEVNACLGYCLNGGVCSLNEENKPVCQCTADYEGERCDISVFIIKCIQTVSMLKDMLNADVTSITPGKGEKATCASTVV